MWEKDVLPLPEPVIQRPHHHWIRTRLHKSKSADVGEGMHPCRLFEQFSFNAEWFFMLFIGIILIFVSQHMVLFWTTASRYKYWVEILKYNYALNSWWKSIKVDHAPQNPLESCSISYIFSVKNASNLMSFRLYFTPLALYSCFLY